MQIAKARQPVSRKKASKDGLQSNCKQCKSTAFRLYYVADRRAQLRRVQKNKKRYAVEVRDYIWAYLRTHHCLDCGESDARVLEFDHRCDKRCAVAVLTSGNYPVSSVSKEIAKCDVRCANCHARKTAISIDNWKQKRTRIAKAVEGGS